MIRWLIHMMSYANISLFISSILDYAVTVPIISRHSLNHKPAPDLLPPPRPHHRQSSASIPRPVIPISRPRGDRPRERARHFPSTNKATTQIQVGLSMMQIGRMPISTWKTKTKTTTRTRTMLERVRRSARARRC